MTSNSKWLQGARPDMVVLAIGKCLGAVMTRGKWIELGLLTSTHDELVSHPRLLRSLYWGDDDYQGWVYEVLPSILGDRRNEPWYDSKLNERFPLLETVSEFLNAPAWLAENEPAIFTQVCASDLGGSYAALPDGVVLNAAEIAAGKLKVSEMRRQIDRIRRDYASDPEAIVGQAKELLESACKTILGLTGTGEGTQVEVPALISQTLHHLGVHASTVAGEGLELRSLKKMFGGLSGVLQGSSELRNKRGTGHGRSGAPLVDPLLARLVVGLTLPAVVYLCELYEENTRLGSLSTSTEKASEVSADPLERRSLVATSGQRLGLTPAGFELGVRVEVGMKVQHATFGSGKVISIRGRGVGREARIDFGVPIGVKRLLLRWAPLKTKNN